MLYFSKNIKCRRNERKYKSAKEKYQITYQGKCIRITADSSTEILKIRKAWDEVF
jgi:hypothetical protein